MNITADRVYQQSQKVYRERILKKITERSNLGIFYCRFATLSDVEIKGLRDLDYKVSNRLFYYTVSWRKPNVKTSR